MTDISSNSSLPLNKIKRPEDWINLHRIIQPEKAKTPPALPPVAQDTGNERPPENGGNSHDILA